MAELDIIFDSFGLYILGLVLLFGSYDIFLRIWHGHGKRKINLIFSFLFLLAMGIILLVLSLLFLARLYADHQILFYSGVIIFLAVAGGTFQIMRWKRQIMNEDRKMTAGFASGTSEPTDQSKAPQTKAGQTKANQTNSIQSKAPQTKAGQTKANHTKTNQTKTDMTKSGQDKCDQDKGK
jgi:hypothetical protein